MANLQDEVLKLLDESKVEESKEQLDEASFDEIQSAASEIDGDALKKNMKIPVTQFNKKITNVVDAIGKALEALNTANETYNTQNAKINKKGQKATWGNSKGVFDYVKNKAGEIRDTADNKEIAISSLRSASRMIAQAQDDMNQARLFYSKINNELRRVARATEVVQKAVDSKLGWFNRMFNFWK